MRLACDSEGCRLMPGWGDWLCNIYLERSLIANHSKLLNVNSVSCRHPLIKRLLITPLVWVSRLIIYLGICVLRPRAATWGQTQTWRCTCWATIPKYQNTKKWVPDTGTQSELSGCAIVRSLWYMAADWRATSRCKYPIDAKSSAIIQ